MRPSVLTALAGLIALLPAAARADEPGLTPTSIKIGMFAPLSGPSASYGQDVANAARMWFDKVNREGGIHGRKIEVVVEDDRCNANDLVAAVKKLVEQENVFLLNGGSCSAAVIAASDYVVRNKIPMVMLNASGDGALYPPTDWIFGSFGISQHAVAGSTVAFAARHFKAKTIGYINHDDNYGAWNIEAAKFQAEKEGVTLNIQSISPSISDVTAPLLRIRAANPDVLVILTYARPAALIVRKAVELGYKGPIVLTVNGTADVGQMAQNVGGAAALQNFYIQEVLADAPGSPRVQWAYDMFRAAYPELANTPGRPQAYMPYGIPSAQAVVNALKAAGPNPTRQGFVDAMKTLNFDSGIMAGPISFTATERAAQQSAIYLKYDGTKTERVPGTFENLWRFH